MAACSQAATIEYSKYFGRDASRMVVSLQMPSRVWWQCHKIPGLMRDRRPKGLCCLYGGFESGVSIFRRHRRGGPDIRRSPPRAD
jgi:hypothetical protein